MSKLDRLEAQYEKALRQCYTLPRRIMPNGSYYNYPVQPCEKRAGIAFSALMYTPEGQDRIAAVQLRSAPQ